MIEGEKKAIEHLNSFLNIPNYIWIKERERLIVNVKIALNLIENQEKYLKQEKEKKKKLEEKIKEKIEYLKQRREKYPEYSYAILYTVDRLKELLEEE